MTSFLIVDAQSVKNTDSAEQKGYDAGKKVSGIKRHIAVDTQGMPHAVAVTTAEVTDRNGAVQAIERCKSNLELVESVLVDGGYTGQPFAESVMEQLKATVLCSRLWHSTITLTAAAEQRARQAKPADWHPAHLHRSIAARPLLWFDRSPLRIAPTIWLRIRGGARHSTSQAP